MKLIKYPSLTTISRIYPQPEILLGKSVLWERKYDGSNIRLYVDKDDNLLCGSRNSEIASEDTYTSLFRTGCIDSIRELLLDEKYGGRNESILFAELLSKGRSPTQIEMHDKDDMIIFDMYGSDGRWKSYVRLYQKCHQFKLPITETLGSSYHTTMQSLYRYRDEMLNACKVRNIEGVVGKTHSLLETKIPLWFKEKIDLFSVGKKDPLEKREKNVLPLLPNSEIMGAIEKVYADIGWERFRDIRIAMPLCAQYINEESKKHFCERVKNPHKYYQQRLEDLFKSK